LFALSCKSKNDNTTIKKINFLEDNKPFVLSTYFSNLKAEALKGDELVGKIDKILVTDENIIVSDFYLMKSLKIFSLKGDLLAYRNYIGDESVGLSEITDFDVFEDILYVFDAFKSKLFKFNLSLELIDEISIQGKFNNFMINTNGLYFFKQGKDIEGERIVFFSHDFSVKYTLLDKAEMNTNVVFSSSNYFTQMDTGSFVFAHPLYPYIYYFKNRKIQKIELDFNERFIDVSQVESLNPLDKLNFVNNFEGYYDLKNGIRLTDDKILFSLKFNGRAGYILIDIKNNFMIFYDKIINDLKKIPSNIYFSSNSTDQVWYYMNEDQITSFYKYNLNKISSKDKILLTNDKNRQIIFILDYK